MPEPYYDIEIESDPNNLITIEEFVNYFAKDLGLSEEQLSVLLLAVTEATTNAIIHANKCNPEKLVKVHAYIEDSKLIIKIKDEGKGLYGRSKIQCDTFWFGNHSGSENLILFDFQQLILPTFYCFL